MDRRETPCAHCKRRVTYPAPDVGMPFTCPHCRLTFDLPEGRPAQAKELKTMCGECSSVIDYLEEIAGQAIPCPKCHTEIQLPGGSTGVKLELADETPAPKKSGGGSVIRGKKGFGRDIVPRTGPRLGGPTRDPQRVRMLIQAVVLLVIAAGLGIGTFLWYQAKQKTLVDKEHKLRTVAEEYIQRVNAADAAGLSEMVVGPPDKRADIAKGLQEKFDKFRYEITQHKITSVVVTDDGGGQAKIDWTFTITDKAKNKSRTWQEPRDMGFRWVQGRWLIVRVLNFPTQVD